MAERFGDFAMSTGAAPLAAPATLMNLVWPSRTALRAAILMVIGSGLLALSAKTQVPFYPVPMTMQTLVVLVLGAAYGWRLGAATVALYLAEGLVGLPVFAGVAAGPAYMAGPTGGFLVGFLFAAMTTGFMAERGWDRSLLRVFLMMTLGHAIIFAFGLGWLSSVMGFEKAVAAGAAPFLWATILKTALAAALMQAAWGMASRTDEQR
jgi:biotin transport system substrate-specific component